MSTKTLTQFNEFTSVQAVVPWSDILESTKIVDDEDMGANWQEQLITSTSDKAKVAKAREWAQANGFNRFRESHFDGTAPDFTKTLNH